MLGHERSIYDDGAVYIANLVRWLRRQWGMRLILLSGGAAVASMVLIGCSSQAVPPSAGRPHQTGLCRSQDLTAAYRLGEGAGSQDYSVIALRNIGGTSCTLDGWPTVRLLDRTGRQIGPAAGRRETTAPTLVRIAPRQRAGVTISVGSVHVPTAADCGREPTGTIALTLPGGSAVMVRATIQVCALEPGLTTGPIHRGTSLTL
jgi:uncharacterized protein DUF4232